MENEKVMSLAKDYKFVDPLRRRTRICKNCTHLLVSVKLPRRERKLNNEEAAEHMREMAKAMTNLLLVCTYPPTWEDTEEYHYCGHFLYRPNWQAGWQDIERTWEEIDRVYATRYDCMAVPEGVRQAA